MRKKSYMHSQQLWPEFGILTFDGQVDWGYVHACCLLHVEMEVDDTGKCVTGKAAEPV